MELLFDGGIRIIVEPGDTKGTVAVWASTGSRVAPNWVTFQLSVAGVATLAAAMKANISTASSRES